MHAPLLWCAAVALAVAVGAALRARPGAAPATGERVDVAAVERGARRAAVFRLLGVIGGGVVALVMAGGAVGRLGLGIALAAPAFALCLLAGVLAGEVAATVPVGASRTATLEVRTARRYLPRGLARWVGALAAGLLVLLTATSLSASPDDLGRAGRSFTLACGPDRSVTAGPWPGSYYSLPIGVAVLVGLGAAALVAHTVARRRRPASDPSTLATDERARRRSARVVTAACGVLVAAPLAGCGLMAGAILVQMPCLSGPMRMAGWASLVLATVAGVSGCLFVADVATSGRRAVR
jgi:hypothetical protein